MHGWIEIDKQMLGLGAQSLGSVPWGDTPFTPRNYGLSACLCWAPGRGHKRPGRGMPPPGLRGQPQVQAVQSREVALQWGWMASCPPGGQQSTEAVVSASRDQDVPRDSPHDSPKQEAFCVLSQPQWVSKLSIPTPQSISDDRHNDGETLHCW